MTNCRIPIYLPKTPVKKKRKKKTKADESAADEKARSPSPTRRPASARLRAADDEEPEINRPEFAQVIRIQRMTYYIDICCPAGGFRFSFR